MNRNSCRNEYSLEFSLFIKDLFIIFTVFFSIIWIIFWISKQRERRIIHNNKYISKHELKLYNPCDQHSMDVQFTAVKPFIVSIDLYIVSPIKIVTFDDHIVPLIDRKQLIYYIDGSYSPRMQIGHSGFRASDGSSTVHCYSPQYPRRGSTESEVYAACLAIQHATKNHCTKLIIRTDNSKVEQLLCRPKNKDHRDYPVFCQILNQYRQENVNNIIRVERVRGHTTRYEQNQCEIKREFAKIDRLVRKKNRRERIKYTRSYQDWYSQYNALTYYRCRVFQYFC